MLLFTTEQTESWQRDIIAGAAQRKALHELAWFIQMIVPLPKSLARTMTQQQRLDYRYRTACAPRDWIPFIPLGSDPAASRYEAEILAGIFAAHNAPEIKFAPALCLMEELTTQKCYEFGQPWDHVCSRCGSVFASTVPNEVALCGGCCTTMYRMAMY